MPSASLSGTARHLVALVFPGRCPGCGCPAEPVCPRCLGALRPPPSSPPPPGVDRWVAAFAYDGVARELVARAKYHGRHAALRWLADRAAEAWRAAGPDPVDVVTWVPTAPRRRRARGLDHARVLALGVADALGCPARPLLERGDGPPQTELPVADRRRGPTVRARGRVPGPVLVVDDVATTGATLRVCAVALRAAGATSVSGLTVARTPAPGDQERTRRAST